MKIQIDGTNSQNKGAELMLVAILQEIEKSYPKSKVYYNSLSDANIDYVPVKTSLELSTRKLIFGYKLNYYIVAVLNKLNLPLSLFTSKRVISGVDVVLDGGGFQFSDQWNYSDKQLDRWENYFRKLKKNGTKIILLPQALGPFETPNGKRTVAIINKYADVIIARDKISYEYVTTAGANKDKVWCYPDFSLTVSGVFPERFANVKGKVCVIPNKKMITHSTSNANEYFKFLENIVNTVEATGRKVFLLNHEAKGDLELCYQINERFNNRLEIVTDLSSLEIKGVIGASYAVISSRFHGVASALNQGIPCFATGWNHKYEMLMKDFGQEKMMVNIANADDTLIKLNYLLDANTNREIKEELAMRKNKLLELINEMWSRIWDKVK